VLLVFLVGVVLRVWGALQFPFEQDELYTAIETRFLLASPLTPGIEARPLYYFLTYPLQSWLPHSPLSLRAPALVFGVLGLWATWLLGRQWGGRPAALMALAFATVVPWHLHASSMGRYWSLVYLTAALGYYLLMRAYETERRVHYAAAFLALLIGSLTHPSFAFPMLGAVLGLTVVRSSGLGWTWPSRRAWIWLWGPYLVALAGWALLLITTGREGSVRNFSGRGTLALLRLIPAMVDLTTPILFVAGMAGAVVLMRASDSRLRRAGLMAGLGTLSACALLLLSARVTSTYADYGIAMLPLVLAAAGCFATREEKPADGRALPGWTTWLTGGVILAAMAPATVSFLRDGNRFDYRPAFRRILSESPVRPVLTWPIILQQEYAPTLDGIELRPRVAYLDSVLAARGEAWAVVSVQRYGIIRDDGGEVARWLSQRCRRWASYGQPRFDYRSYFVDLHLCRAAPTQHNGG
jgi:hypothetical protein